MTGEAHLNELGKFLKARLEQGRLQPSAPVLVALVKVLHLGNHQRDLFELAGRRTACDPRRGDRPPYGHPGVESARRRPAH